MWGLIPLHPMFYTSLFNVNSAMIDRKLTPEKIIDCVLGMTDIQAGREVKQGRQIPGPPLGGGAEDNYGVAESNK